MYYLYQFIQLLKNHKGLRFFKEKNEMRFFLKFRI